MNFFTQLFLRAWSGLLCVPHWGSRRKTVRCETCPRWRYHSTVNPAFGRQEAGSTTFALVPLGVCSLAKPAIVSQGGIGFGVKLFHPSDWCPNHPLYVPAPASDLPKYSPPAQAVARNSEGMEPEAFDRAPTLDEAMRLARVLQEPDATPKRLGKAS